MSYVFNIPKRILEHELARQHAVAMCHPRYAAIEHRRQVKGASSSITVEESSDWDEFKEQLDILATIKERPWVPFVRVLQRNPAKTAVVAARRARQRSTRGWDETAVWALDDHICSTLAAQLNELAASTNGWPDSAFDTVELYVGALRHNAALLEGYATRHSTPAHAHVHALKSSDPEYLKALARASDEESRVVAEAQTALIWVAGMLPHLWD